MDNDNFMDVNDDSEICSILKKYSICLVFLKRADL